MSGLRDPQRFRRDHRWACGRLSDYVDGDMAQAGRGRIERHLGECTECRRLLDGLRRTVSALQRLSAPSGSVDAQAIAASVRARLTGPG